MPEAGWDQDDVAGTDVLRWPALQFDLAGARKDQVAFGGVAHTVPGRRHTGVDAGAGDGQRIVGGGIRHLEDVAAFRRIELGLPVGADDGGFHGNAPW